MTKFIPEHLQYDVYCDGGVIVSNPSPYGGTFAWCVVNKTGKRVQCDSGVIEPKDIGMPKVTNNFSELYATIHALEAMPTGWAGILWTDSLITYRRLNHSPKFKNIPDWLRNKCLQLRHNKLWTVMHCGGHPTASDLEVGYDERGLPVNKFNVWCDARCREEADKFMSKLSSMRSGNDKKEAAEKRS